VLRQRPGGSQSARDSHLRALPVLRQRPEGSQSAQAGIREVYGQALMKGDTFRGRTETLARNANKCQNIRSESYSKTRIYIRTFTELQQKYEPTIWCTDRCIGNTHVLHC
jgi:hypothetical protein